MERDKGGGVRGMGRQKSEWSRRRYGEGQDAAWVLVEGRVVWIPGEGADGCEEPDAYKGLEERMEV